MIQIRKWLRKVIHLSRSDRGELNLPTLIGALIAVILIIVLVPFINSLSTNMNTNSALTYLENQGYWVLAGGSHCVPGTLSPCFDASYDLGAIVQRWKDGYYSGNIQSSTANITGNATISGNLTTGKITTATANITGNTTVSGNLTAKTGRSSTVTVAAADSTWREQIQADYLCDNVTDAVTVQAAIDSANSGGIVKLLPGNYYFGNSGITCAKVITFDFDGAIIRYSGNATILDFSISATPVLRGTNIIGGIIRATTSNNNNTGVVAIKVKGHGYGEITAKVYYFYGGTALNIDSSNVPYIYTEGLEIGLTAINCKYGVTLTGDGSMAYNHFKYLNWSGSVPTVGTGGSAIDCTGTTTTSSNGWTIDTMRIWPLYTATTNASYGINGSKLTLTQIDKCIVDGVSVAGAGFVLFNNADNNTYIRDLQITSMAAGYQLRYPNGLLPRIDSYYYNSAKVYGLETVPLYDSISYYTVPITLTPATAFGAVSDVTGAYSTGYTITGIRVRSGNLTALNSIGGSYGAIDVNKTNTWTPSLSKRLFWTFNAYTSGTTSTAYIKLSSNNNTGILDLPTAGLAVKFSGSNVYFQTRGTTLYTSGLLYTLTSGTFSKFVIEYTYLGYAKLYIDGILRDTVTNATDLPTSAVTSNLIIAITNGATGEQDDLLVNGMKFDELR